MAEPKRRRSEDSAWASRFALIASVFALVVSGYGIKVSHQDRSREGNYSVRAQVRNLSAKERAFGNSSSAKPGDLLEFRGRLHNWGNYDARDITINVTVPSLSAGRYVMGSCRVIKPEKAPVRCQNRMSERELMLPALAPDETMEVRFKERTRLPPCDGYRAATTFTARSIDRTAVSDTASASVARSRDGLVCGGEDAALMALIPLAYRDKCRLKHYNSLVGDALAHIGCPNPDGEIREVEFYRYSDERKAKSVYRRRLDSISRSSRRQCSTDEDGEGFITYRGHSRQELRYFCWYYQGSDGNSSWIEILNRRHKLYVNAYRADDDWDALYDWANNNTP